MHQSKTHAQDTLPLFSFAVWEQYGNKPDKGENTPNLQDLDHSQQTIKEWKHPKTDHTMCSGLLLRAIFFKAMFSLSLQLPVSPPRLDRFI